MEKDKYYNDNQTKFIARAQVLKKCPNNHKEKSYMSMFKRNPVISKKLTGHLSLKWQEANSSRKWAYQFKQISI